MGANYCVPIAYHSQNISLLVLNSYGNPCPGGMVYITLMIYSMILILGLLLNICICVVFARNYTMKSATNYYLLSLSVSDLLSLLLGVPFEIEQSVHGFYPYKLPLLVCKVRGMVTECTSYVSVLTVAAFAGERWFAICRPLRFSTTSKYRRVMRTLVCIWVVSALASLPVFHYITINRLYVPPYFRNNTQSSHDLSDTGYILHTELCAMDISRITAQKLILHTSFWFFFVLPFLIMTALFWHIAYVVGKSADDHEAAGSAGSNKVMAMEARKRTRAKKTVARMLGAVGSTFFICWLPFHLQRLMIVHYDEGSNDIIQKILNIVFYITGYFYYANTVINPILYNVCNNKFRQAFIETIFHCRSVNRRKYQSNRRKLMYETGHTFMRTRYNTESSTTFGGFRHPNDTPSYSDVDFSARYSCMDGVSSNTEVMIPPLDGEGARLSIVQKRPLSTAPRNVSFHKTDKCIWNSRGEHHGKRID